MFNLIISFRDTSRGEIQHLDGRRSRYVAVTYELTTGQEAQVFVQVDNLGVGETMIDLDGEPPLYGAAAWGVGEAGLEALDGYCA